MDSFWFNMGISLISALFSAAAASIILRYKRSPPREIVWNRVFWVEDGEDIDMKTLSNHCVNYPYASLELSTVNDLFLLRLKHFRGRFYPDPVYCEVHFDKERRPTVTNGVWTNDEDGLILIASSELTETLVTKMQSSKHMKLRLYRNRDDYDEYDFYVHGLTERLQYV